MILSFFSEQLELQNKNVIVHSFCQGLLW